jgi:hypothetical protein
VENAEICKFAPPYGHRARSVRGQRSEVRGRKSEVIGHRSEVGGPSSGASGERRTQGFRGLAPLARRLRMQP